MELHEYAQFDGLKLAELVRSKEIKASELAELALQAIEKVNPELNAVIGLIIEKSDRHWVGVGSTDTNSHGIDYIIAGLQDFSRVC